MRLGFLGVTLFLVSVVAVACGGRTLELDAELDAEPASPADRDAPDLGSAYASHCDELQVAVQHYTECTEQSVPSDYFEGVRRHCERDTAQTPTRCVSEFRELTRCQVRGLEACDRESRSCEAEELAYAECVSGGTCQSVGGGSHGPRPGGLEAFTTHLACQCIEQDEQAETAPEGGACDTPFDCQIVCCPCSLPNTEYNGAVCDKSATGGTGRGVCMGAEAACAATSFRCERM